MIRMSSAWPHLVVVVVVLLMLHPLLQWSWGDMSSAWYVFVVVFVA